MLGDLFQPTHLLLVLLICLLVFGPSKLPELGKGLGEGIRGFREAFRNGPAPGPTPGSAPGTDSEKK